MIRYSCPRHQTGQALVLVVLLLGVLVAAVYMGYNVAQVASTKSRVMHASDNAAYSAANYQARIMNYMAYTNRAMITNHVTTAQMVTARGYVEYDAGMSSRIANYTAMIPYLNSVTRAINQAVQYARTGIENGSALMIGYSNTLNYVLQASQLAVWAGAESRMPAVVRDVAKANLSEAQVEGVPLAMAAANYYTWTQVFSSQGELWRFGRTVQNDRDRWTANRGHDGLKDIFALVNLGNFTVRNERWAKRGGTELSNLNRWESTDDMSWKKENLRCRWFRCRWRDQELNALGWGSATSGSGSKKRGDPDYGYSKATNSMSTSYAWNNQKDISVRYSGIGRFVDLRDSQRNKNLPVVVEVYVDRNAVKTANQGNSRLVAGPNLRTNDQFVAGRIASISKAETRFVRPTPRSGGSVELASTFSPYWQATLVSPSTGDMALSDILSGRGFVTQTPYY